MAAALQHLQLYTYDALIESIHRTVNIPVQQRELAQPTSNLVELLYTKFIQLIFGFEFDEYLAEIHQQPDSQFADAFVLKIVLRYLRNILRLTSGISWIEGKTPVPFDVVRISDITEPNPTRTKVILSCLINVVNLRDGELEFYTKVRQQLLSQTEERRTSLEKIEKLTAEVQRERAIADERRKAIEDEERKKAERDYELAEAERARKKTKQEHKELKNELKSKLEKKQSLNDQVNESERRNNELRGRLVRSPDRVKSEIGNIGDEVAEKRDVVQAAEEMNRNLQAKLDKLQQIERDSATIKKHLEELEKVIDQRGEQLALVQTINEDMEKHRIAYSEEMNNKATWEQKGVAAKERVDIFQSRISNERHDLATKTVEVNEEYERVTQERSRADHRIDEDNEQATEMEKEIAAMIAENDKAIKEALADHWRLVKQADEYIAAIAKRLHLPMPVWE